jgi:hypothetical protein
MKKKLEKFGRSDIEIDFECPDFQKNISQRLLVSAVVHMETPKP